jgi:hypothetical protein
MKKLFAATFFSLMLAAGVFAGAQNISQPQALTDAEMSQVTGGDICITCRGVVEITIDDDGVTVECEEFVSIEICSD